MNAATENTTQWLALFMHIHTEINHADQIKRELRKLNTVSKLGHSQAVLPNIDPERRHTDTCI